MKALVFDKSKTSWDGSKGFEMIEVPDLKIEKDDEVIVKVEFAGVCGTDKGIWYRQVFGQQILQSLQGEQKPYRIVGHEFVGQIVALGAAAAAKYSLAVGTSVSGDSHIVCNVCARCRAGQKNICEKQKILGVTYDGCFAQYLKVPGHALWKNNPQKIRPEIAAIQDPFGNAMHAASKVNLQDKTAAIFGLGSIGLFTVLIARALGVRTLIGIEPNRQAREMAEQLGVHHLINPPSGSKDFTASTEVLGQISKLTKGSGVDVAFEMAGQNSSLNNALQATRRGGDVILFGIKNADFVIQNYNELIIRGLTLHAVIGRQIWQTWQAATKLLEDQGNKIQEQIYKVILREGQDTILPISEYTKDIFEQKLAGYPKILFKF